MRLSIHNRFLTIDKLYYIQLDMLPVFIYVIDYALLYYSSVSLLLSCRLPTRRPTDISRYTLSRSMILTHCGQKSRTWDSLYVNDSNAFQSINQHSQTMNISTDLISLVVLRGKDLVSYCPTFRNNFLSIYDLHEHYLQWNSWPLRPPRVLAFTRTAYSMLITHTSVLYICIISL